MSTFYMKQGVQTHLSGQLVGSGTMLGGTTIRLTATRGLGQPIALQVEAPFDPEMSMGTFSVPITAEEASIPKGEYLFEAALLDDEGNVLSVYPQAGYARLVVAPSFSTAAVE